MIAVLDDYHWAEAFGFAGEPGTAAASANVSRCEGAECSDAPFAREDVEILRHIREGEPDGLPWLALGRLRDGRFFYLEAGCDFTGWDCIAEGSVWVSHDYDNLLRFGVTDTARNAWGL